MREAHRPWTSRALSEFCAEYPFCPNPVLAKKYGRTRVAVERMAVKYGLHKTTTEEMVRAVLRAADGPMAVRMISAYVGKDCNRAVHYALKKLVASGEVYCAKRGYWGLVR